MSLFGRRRAKVPLPVTAARLVEQRRLSYRLSRVQRFTGDSTTLFEVLCDVASWPAWVPGASHVEALSWDEPGLRVRVQGRRLGVAVDAVHRMDPSHGPLLTTVAYESLLVGGKPYSYGDEHLLWYELSERVGYTDVEAGFASRPGSGGKAFELRAASPLITRDLQAALAGLIEEATRREG